MVFWFFKRVWSCGLVVGAGADIGANAGAGVAVDAEVEGEDDDGEYLSVRSEINCG